jgi:hypothetical protein
MIKSAKRKVEPVEDLLRDLLIVQLGIAGLTGHQIREIVGVDMNRVTRILKHLKKRKK